jgi:glycosyltransferase involved in cell wall biosynthesis
MPDLTVQHGIEVHRVDSLFPLIEQRPGDVLRARARISAIIAEFDPDVIHLHPCGPELVYYLPIWTKRPIPTVLTLHNNYSGHCADYGPASMFGRAFHAAGRIAAVSADARDWMLSLHPTLSDKTSVIHNGVPLPPAPVRPLPWDRPVVSYIGRLEVQKRMDRLLEAFALVSADHDEVRLRIVGDGTHLASTREQAAALGIDGRVEFFGAVDPERVPGLLHETTIFALSSDFEGLPMAVLEAAGHGRPIVSTRAGGVPEAVLDERTGLLVDDDPAALARALDRLLRDRALAERLGSAARDHIETAFSMPACARAYDRLYAQAADSAAQLVDVAPDEAR